MKTKLNLEAFRYALSNFGKGTVFEEFAKSFLAHVFGDELIPIGGTKDKGIDASMRIYSRKTQSTFIYQISTETNYQQKIKESLEVLVKNEVTVDQLIYVTCRKINDKNAFEDNFLLNNKVPLKIFDVEWFTSNVINSETLITLYETFIDSNVHEFQKPDKEYVVGNFIDDPRLYIFLRHQFNDTGASKEVEIKLADTLILYALEGTASETSTFRSNLEIKEKISHLVKFDPRSIHKTIDERLIELAKKPNQINFHPKEMGFCLPYPTRVKLKERDIVELEIYETFKEETTELLKGYLSNEKVKITQAFELIEETIHKIYHRQGIEFSSLILEGQSREIFEVALTDIVNEAVDNSRTVLRNRQQIKRALLMTIRKMCYQSSACQREYLRRLSQTYSMMFMLRWDPHLSASFQKIASQLTIFVGTSILIPAMSEIFLERNQRRYWNLLEGANQAGVQLYVNQAIIDELVQHFGMIRSKYRSQFKSVEKHYLSDEMSMHYVDEIMIRAYFYSKSNGKVKSFNEFIEEFANPNLLDAERDLLDFLKDEFKIKFEDTSNIERQLDEKEVDSLTEELTPFKNSEEKARTDAKLILTIFKLRELNNENTESNIFGYRTWWLSQDINTYKAVTNIFKKKYRVNCYMRSDFLYNYISLAPKRTEIDNMFKEVFPSLMGINLSYHMPKDICSHVNESLIEHAGKSPTRIKRAIRGYTEKLMSTSTRSIKKLKSHFDEELENALK